MVLYLFHLINRIISLFKVEEILEFYEGLCVEGRTP